MGYDKQSAFADSSNFPQLIANADDIKRWHFGWQRHGAGVDPEQYETAPDARMRAPLSNQRLKF